MYQVTINTPGYLPWSDDVITFDKISEAWEWLAEERARQFEALDLPVVPITGLESLLSQDQCGAVYLGTPGYDGDHDLGLAYCVSELRHSDYPHEPGRLPDCPACQARCHCTPGTAECVYEGDHEDFGDQVTCGHCGRSWWDKITPTPSPRCPFEYEHVYDNSDHDDPIVYVIVRDVVDCEHSYAAGGGKIACALCGHEPTHLFGRPIK